jgi:hypothetical protein
LRYAAIIRPTTWLATSSAPYAGWLITPMPSLGGVKVDRVQPDAGPPDHPYVVCQRGQPIGV